MDIANVVMVCKQAHHDNKVHISTQDACKCVCCLLYQGLEVLLGSSCYSKRPTC
jgi:hypothetical protein